MEKKLLRTLYDCFYIRPEFVEQEEEVRECHKALIEVLAKPERKLVLRIIDAQDYIKTETSLDSFIAGFELAWRLSAELHNDESERQSPKNQKVVHSLCNGKCVVAQLIDYNEVYCSSSRSRLDISSFLCS